jgi:hypothetical protein
MSAKYSDLNNLGIFWQLNKNTRATKDLFEDQEDSKYYYQAKRSLNVRAIAYKRY